MPRAPHSQGVRHDRILIQQKPFRFFATAQLRATECGWFARWGSVFRIQPAVFAGGLRAIISVGESVWLLQEAGRPDQWW